MKQMHCPHCRFEVTCAPDSACPVCGHPIDTASLSSSGGEEESFDASAAGGAEWPEISPDSRYGSGDGALADGEEADTTGPDPDDPEFDAGDSVAAPAEPDATPESHGLLHLMLYPMGRINRRGYIVGLLATACLMAIGMLAACCSNLQDEGKMEAAIQGCFLLAALPLFPLTIKRLHDCGYSGFLTLLVPFCGGFLFVLALMLVQGSRFRNQYGRRPHLPWTLSGSLGLLLLMMSGVYSVTVLTVLFEAERLHDSAFAHYDQSNLQAALPVSIQAYEQAARGSRSCPMCEEFVALGMGTAFIAGHTYWTQSETDSAVVWLTRAERLATIHARHRDDAEMDAFLASVRLMLADALEAKGDIQNAATFRAAAGSPLPHQQDLTIEEQIATLWVKVSNAATRGLYRDAEQLCSRIIQLIEKHPDRCADAAQHLYELGGAHHDRSLMRYHQGDIGGALSDSDAAMQYLLQAHELQPANDTIRLALTDHCLMRGRLSMEQGDIESASKVLSQARDRDPDHPEVAGMLGVVRYQQLDFAEAASLLKTAVQHTGSVELHAMHVAALLQLGRLEQADIAIRRIERQFQESAQGAFLRGTLLLIKNDYPAAIEAQQDALRVFPTGPGILHNLIVSLRCADRNAEAESLLLQLQPIAPRLARSAQQFVRATDGQTQTIPISFLMEP